LPSTLNDWSAHPNERLFSVLSEMDVKERWICTLKKRSHLEKLALGQPIDSTQDKEEFELHVPSFIINSLETKPNEVINALFSCSSQLPKAVSLSFKIIGEIPEWLDLKEILEEYLSHLGVLRRGQILPVPLLEDGQALLASYESYDPFVFLHGEEVGLDILEDVNEIAKVSETIPEGIFRPTKDYENIDFNSMSAETEKIFQR